MMRYLGAFAMAAPLLVAVAAEPVSAQKTDGILKMYSPDSPASMSIHEEATFVAEGPMMGVFNNLVVFDQQVKQNSLDSIVPDLATAWSWNEDGTELILPLRQGVTWHDGRPFTAKDVDSKTSLQDRVDADPGPTVDPICFVRPGNQEDQCDARVLDHVLDAVDPIVAAPVGDQQCAAVVVDLDEARLVALGRAVEPLAAPCRQDKKWRGGDEGTSHRIDVVDLFPEDAL